MFDPRDIEALADALAPRIVGLLWRTDDFVFPARGLVEVDDVCRLLRVEREWVYAHKSELGAIRIGDGARGALRFDAAKVHAYLAERRVQRAAGRAPRRRGGRPRKRPRGNDFEILDIPEAA